MTITGHQSAFALEHRTFGKHAITDMQALYGGDVTHSRRLGSKRFSSTDMQVTALVQRKSPKTVVGIYDLDRQKNAAR